MEKKIGLFWLRDDFRTVKNDGLIEATRNHDQVVVFYLYKQDTYKDQEAQKWWLSKSLISFRKKLNNYNISLQVVETNSFKIFFDKLTKKNNFAIYWNKVYEPDYLKFDEYLSSNLIIFIEFNAPNILRQFHIDITNISVLNCGSVTSIRG